MNVTTDNLIISVLPAVRKTIIQPKIISYMDKLYMANSDTFLVTKANQKQIELMIVNRKLIQKNDISNFLK